MNRFTMTSLFTLTLGASSARADSVKEFGVARSRIFLSDVAPLAPATVASLDLGPAPRPGASRLLDRSEIAALLPEGITTNQLALPSAVRVVRKSRVLSASQIKKLATTTLNDATLDRGAKLAQVRSSAAVLVPDGYDRVSARLKPLPRKAGRLSTSATLTFWEGDNAVADVEVPVDLDLPKSAAEPDIKKGARLTLVISRDLIDIRTAATANSDADIGESLPVTLVGTGKSMRATLLSKSSATPVSP
jgi:hypothetical protein